jgi:putative ABC transport system permease protein
MLTQAIAIGLLGSVVGVGLGVALAAAMVAYVRTVGSITLGRPATPPDAAAVAFLVGLGVTAAAALEPARRAGRIQPVEALKARLDLPAARRARLRWLAAVFVIVSLVGLVVAPRGAGVVSSVVVYAILLGGTLLTPLVLPVVARGAGIPFAILLRFEERLAPRPSSATQPDGLTLALTIGLAMIVALGGVGQHARAAAGAWIADVIPGELLLTSIRPVAADEAIDSEIAAVPGIARISPIATFDVALDGTRTDAAAVVGRSAATAGAVPGGRPRSALRARRRWRPSCPPPGGSAGAAVTRSSSCRRRADSRRTQVVGIVRRSIPGSAPGAVGGEPPCWA